MLLAGRTVSFGVKTSYCGKEAQLDRLSIVLILITGPVLVGGLVIIVLGMGYYDWPPIVLAAALGLVLTWPAAYAISRWFKLKDPDWRLRGGARKGTEKRQDDFPET